MVFFPLISWRGKVQRGQVICIRSRPYWRQSRHSNRLTGCRAPALCCRNASQNAPGMEPCLTAFFKSVYQVWAQLSSVQHCAHLVQGSWDQPPTSLHQTYMVNLQNAGECLWKLFTKDLSKQAYVQWNIQFSSVTQSCLTLCDPMDCSVPGLPVHHQLAEFTQTHAYFGYYYSFTGYGVLKSPTISVLPSISPFRSVSICFVYLGIPVLGA